MTKPLDWRGFEQQEKFCALARDPSLCIQETNDALRPILNPVARQLSGDEEADPCDYGQTAYDLIALGNALHRIGAIIALETGRKGAVEEKDPILLRNFFQIRIGELASQVVAERMVQECQCKGK